MTTSNMIHDLISHIGSELKLLWAQLDAYQELFVVEQDKRSTLLQDIAPGFFPIYQVSLAESILMRICRLMDPPESCGNKNSTLHSFCNALSEDPVHTDLQSGIQKTIDDWNQKDSGPFSTLRVARNKWLAHNDFSERSAISPEKLWIPLTNEDFNVTRTLASRLWTLYRKSYNALYKTDTVEPCYSRLEERPSNIIKALCASQYLNCVLQESPQMLEEYRSFEDQAMGGDSLRTVFNAENHSPDQQQNFDGV